MNFFADMSAHLALVFVACLVVTTDVAQATESAPSTRVEVLGTTLSIPESSLHWQEGSFLLRTDEQSLVASMQSHQMIEQYDASSNEGHRRFEFPASDAPLKFQGLIVVPLQKKVEGKQVYWVKPVANKTRMHAEWTCELAANEPWTLFNVGLAHKMWGKVVAQANGSHQSEALAVTLVDLRHAASLLPPSWQGDSVTDGCAQQSTVSQEAPSASQIADSVIWHSAGAKKRLALTFDACSTFNYGPFNPNVIAALRAHDVPATLFVGGHWAEMHPQVLRDLAQDPLFEIGNHSYSHPHMRDLEPEQQAQELRWTQALIYNTTGKVPRMFRPPYGEVDDTMLKEVARAGLTTVEYDLPAGDADVHVSSGRLTDWVVRQARPGSIVIMHMNRPKNHTASALPMIVKKLRAEGYTFCQMSDLLHDEGRGCR